MNRYTYIGVAPGLLRHTALGSTIDGEFRVQVDDIKHPWSHGWHRAVASNWDLIPSAFDDEKLGTTQLIPLTEDNMITDKQWDAINEIMDNFDFARVAKVMRGLRWKWGLAPNAHVPEEYEIRQHARSRLVEVYRKNYARTDTGGFVVERSDNSLSISFVLTEWTAETGLHQYEPTRDANVLELKP